MKVNTPDTLFTRLRDITRRLRLLEASRSGVAAMLVAATGAARTAAPPAAQGFAPPSEESTPQRASIPTASVQLSPARPQDWPGTAATGWERLLEAWAMVREPGASVILETAADTSATGEARLLVDGQAVAPALSIAADRMRYVLRVGPTDPRRPESEIAVEARRTSGSGVVRVVARLVLGSVEVT